MINSTTTNTRLLPLKKPQRSLQLHYCLPQRWFLPAATSRRAAAAEIALAQGRAEAEAEVFPPHPALHRYPSAQTEPI